MLALGSLILIAGMSVVIFLCWAWLPSATIAKLFRMCSSRNRDADLLPMRAGGFVPPPQVLRRDPHAFNPEVRHHEFLKVDPRRMFPNREARDAYEATFGLERKKGGDGFERQATTGARQPSRPREQRKHMQQSTDPGRQSGVQRPAATLSQGRDREREKERGG
ncbi:hypothetical protein diail_7275 [Diaporthe ilicicola]|nr:hypothetical protein diail_7275 [Diaporthe ilicicola]